jgi:hypothetical protein
MPSPQKNVPDKIVNKDAFGHLHKEELCVLKVSSKRRRRLKERTIPLLAILKYLGILT